MPGWYTIFPWNPCLAASSEPKACWALESKKRTSTPAFCSSVNLGMYPADFVQRHLLIYPYPGEWMLAHFSTAEQRYKKVHSWSVLTGALVDRTMHAHQLSDHGSKVSKTGY